MISALVDFLINGVIGGNILGVPLVAIGLGPAAVAGGTTR